MEPGSITYPSTAGGNVVTQSKPDFDADNTSTTEDGTEIDEPMTGVDAQEQTPNERAVERIMKLPATKYYEFLDILYNADEQTIKNAYRKTSLLVHPDKNKHLPAATDAFQS
jgi:hypothetical protein